jgi:hypothetical protein
MKLNVSAEKALKYLSILSIFLIVDGLVYNIIYYKRFGIPFTTYVETTEILVLFAPLAIEIIIQSIPYSIIYFILVSSINRYRTSKKKVNQELPDPDKSWGSIIFSSAFGFGCGCIAGYFLNKLSSTFFTNWILVAVLSQLFFTINDILHKYADKISINRPLFNFVIINVLLFVYYTFLPLIEPFQKTLKGLQMVYIEIILKDSSKIISDSVNIYLGQTRNHLFMYNKTHNTASIMPKSEISQMKLTDNTVR